MPGLLSRLRAALSPLVEERRQLGQSVGWSVGLSSGASTFTTARAENLSTILACTNAISSALASLPARVYRQVDKGRVEAPRHPVSRLLSAPNTYQTWPDWLEMMLGSVLCLGNAISVIETDGAGRPTGLLPVPWNAGVMVSLLPNGRMAYDIQPTGFVAFPVKPGRYFADEVFHLKDRTDNGLVGRSRLSRAPELLAGILDLSTFSASVWRNGASPTGFLRHPGALSREAKDYITASFTDRFGGPSNARKTPILEEGMEWIPGGATPEDAELLGSRRFSVEELCRVMQVPPPIVQAYEYNTFTNAAQADQWFARHSLMPWARKIEAEFSRSVFGEESDFHLELDFSAMVRGSYAERWQVGIAAVTAGILTANELREQEGYGPIPAANGEDVGAAA